MISEELIKAVCEEYFWYRTNKPQSETRTVLHELVMKCFRIAGIEFQDREDAARIAIRIAKQ